MTHSPPLLFVFGRLPFQYAVLLAPGHGPTAGQEGTLGQGTGHRAQGNIHCGRREQESSWPVTHADPTVGRSRATVGVALPPMPVGRRGLCARQG